MHGYFSDEGPRVCRCCLPSGARLPEYILQQHPEAGAAVPPVCCVPQPGGFLMPVALVPRNSKPQHKAVNAVTSQPFRVVRKRNLYTLVYQI